MREYNVHEVLSILEQYYITNSQQMVTRWIREGKIPAMRSENRKEGYKVLEEDLYEFIEEQRPGLRATFEGYKEYIKILKQGLIEDELKHDEIEGEITSEKEEIDLKEQLEQLENTIIDLHEERQINEMKLIENMEHNNELLQENMLLNELFEMLDKQNKELKEKLNNEVKFKSRTETENEHSVNDVIEKSTQLTFEDFKKLSNEISSNYDFQDADNHMTIVYKKMYDENGIPKKELVMPDGGIKCPYSHKTYKQQKRLVKSAVLCYFEKLQSKDDESQLELTMANE